MHDVITVGIPLLAILGGILFNRQDVKELRVGLESLRLEVRTEISGLRLEMRSEIRDLRSEMNARFDSVQRDMREFYAEQAKHDLRIVKLEQQSA